MNDEVRHALARTNLETITDYEFERELGRGEMAGVYLVRRKKNNRRVALKLMLCEAAVKGQDLQFFLQKLEVIVVSLRHQNVVQLIDHGKTKTVLYFVMDYCNCGSVDDLIQEHGGKLSIVEAHPIMTQALEGLSHMHLKGIVHGGIKPTKILFYDTGTSCITRITCFDTAKFYKQPGLDDCPSDTFLHFVNSRLPFMPREWVIGFRHLKPASDVWSIGATFYNMLTGNFPRDFRPGQDPIAVVLNGIIVPIRERDANIPAKVAEVVDRALALDVKDRYQDAGEMLKAMKKVL